MKSVENVLVSLYYRHPPQYEIIVQAILDKLDPKASNPGGLPREVIDIGMRAALACGNKAAAYELAEISKPLVRLVLAVEGFVADERGIVDTSTCWLGPPCVRGFSLE